MSDVLPGNPTVALKRKTTVSVGFGIGAAILVTLIGPIFGGLVLILSFALVFRTADRVRLGWLFVAFAAAWVPLVVVLGPPSDGWFLWTAVGFIPLALSAATVVVARARSR